MRCVYESKASAVIFVGAHCESHVAEQQWFAFKFDEWFRTNALLHGNALKSLIPCFYFHLGFALILIEFQGIAGRMNVIYKILTEY